LTRFSCWFSAVDAGAYALLIVVVAVFVMYARECSFIGPGTLLSRPSTV
jgi:hypothetical protein